MSDLYRTGEQLARGTTTVLQAVRSERDAQDRRWGQQDHPPLTPGWGYFDQQGYINKAEYWKQENGFRGEEGKLAWDGILLEEVYEALAENDTVLREAELVQVAAVAVAMVEASRRARGVL